MPLCVISGLHYGGINDIFAFLEYYVT